MRIAVIGELHDNTRALRAALADAGLRGIERLVVLRYGANADDAPPDTMAVVDGQVFRTACAMPDQLARGGRITVLTPMAGGPTSRGDDEYRAAARALRARQPAARVCLGLFEPAAACVSVDLHGVVRRDDTATAIRIDDTRLTFVSPGGVGRRRDDAGIVAYATVDDAAGAIAFHSVRCSEETVTVHRSGMPRALDAHTARVAAELRAWLSGASRPAA